MSGSILTTFNYGPFQGWGLTIDYSGTPGELATARVLLTAPYRRVEDVLTCGLVVSRMADDYDEIADAVAHGGGHEVMQRVAAWLVESMRGALLDPAAFWLPVPAHTVPLWRAMVDRADHSAAEWYARYGDNMTRPPFEIVGRLLYVHAADTLVAA